MTNEIIEKQDTQLGQIKMADDVVATIAALAATEVPGVIMSGGIVDGIAEVLRRKNLTKGVSVEVGEKEAAVDINIIIEYGTKIPEIVGSIQQNVSKAIFSMTGLNVVEVNINVQGVTFKEEAIAEDLHRVK